MHHTQLLATIDLGSNSFRLEISRCAPGRIERVQYLKEIVRQGNSLDASGQLSLAAMQRGWECLARFAECLATFAPIRVHAIATQTLREAHNRDVFLQRGSALLGYPIELLSGTEEAQLVYQGVACLVPPSDEKRLVLDIGGRSTELILGQHDRAQAMASFPVGSVSWSMRYFADGELTEQAFASAQASASAALAPALAVFQRSAWQVAYGSSGTVTAANEILISAGRSSPSGSCIHRSDVDWLQQQLIDPSSACHQMATIQQNNRRPIIGAGISVLRAVFALLDIDTLHMVRGALRQGVLHALLAQPAPSAALALR